VALDTCACIKLQDSWSQSRPKL